MSGIIETLLLAFTIGLTGALAPGPTLVVTVNTSLRRGWSTGPKVAAGHALVEMAIFLLILKGAAMAVKEYAEVIAIVGGISLIIFGALTLKESRGARMSSPDEEASGNPYLAGVVTSAANPYFWIWWLTIGSALVLAELECGLLLAAIFMVGHWGADFGWYTLVSTSIDRGRSVLSENGYRNVLALCGTFLVFFGAYYLKGAIPSF